MKWKERAVLHICRSSTKDIATKQQTYVQIELDHERSEARDLPNHEDFTTDMATRMGC